MISITRARLCRGPSTCNYYLWLHLQLKASSLRSASIPGMTRLLPTSPCRMIATRRRARRPSSSRSSPGLSPADAGNERLRHLSRRRALRAAAFGRRWNSACSVFRSSPCRTSPAFSARGSGAAARPRRGAERAAEAARPVARTGGRPRPRRDLRPRRAGPVNGDGIARQAEARSAAAKRGKSTLFSRWMCSIRSSTSCAVPI